MRTRASACPRCSRTRRASARRGGATCTATATTCRACCPSSTTSASTRSTTPSSRPTAPDGITGHHFRRYRPPGPGRAHRQPDDRPVARADLAQGPGPRAGAARLGRLRAHPPHRRGRGARLLHDHAVRERDRRRPALHALLRDGHRRSRARVQGDDAARRWSASATTAPTAFKHWAFAPEPADHVREHVRRVGASRREHDRRLLRGRRAPARVPRRSADAPVSDDEHRARARRGDVRAERGEPAAVGVRRRPRRRASRRDRRPHPARRGRRTAARSRRAGSRRSCSPTSTRGATGGVAGAPVHIVVCADIERGLEADRAVVDLPRGAEPAARRDRARPRQRAHDDHGRLPRRAQRVCSACPTTWSPSRSSRSATRRARSAHPDATRSRRTPTASSTASPGRAENRRPARTDQQIEVSAVTQAWHHRRRHMCRRPCVRSAVPALSVDASASVRP